MTSRSFSPSRHLRLLSHLHLFWGIRALLFTAVLALFVACLFESRVKENPAPPVLQQLQDTTINVGQTLEITLVASDSNGDTLSYSMENAPSGASLTEDLFTWTPDPDQAGSYTIEFTVIEQTADSLWDTASVQVTVLKEPLTTIQWKFNEITYGLEKKMVVGGDEMLALVDTIPAQSDPLFGSQRECFYNVKWKHPGACVEDDSWIFSADGSFAVQDGEAACPERPDLPAGTWSVNEEKTEISLSVSGETLRFAVEELTSDNLRLSQTRTDTTACGSTVLVKTSFSFSAL